MNTAHYKNQMKLFEQAINTADLALAEQLIAEDAQFTTPVSSDILVGAKGYLSVVHFMRQGFPDVQWHLQEMVAEGNTVAVRWHCTGTHLGEFMGVPATGNPLSMNVMNFYRFNEQGKIIDDIAAEGMVAVLRTLKLLP
ncbi:ester cyclase [Actinobacillus capsulatus]|uniref:ester cyclase n=1 Tax=Actinobacillus capsulatus TaxID=717 RepID=UPI00035F3DAE|nr:ester cyclase [Actinobacillus capsulatus]